MVCAIPIVVGGVGCAPREGLHGWFAQSPLTLWASGGVYMVGLSNPHSGWRGVFGGTWLAPGRLGEHLGALGS